jgi:hypothetical protein
VGCRAVAAASSDKGAGRRRPYNTLILNENILPARLNGCLELPPMQASVYKVKSQGIRLCRSPENQ